MSIETDGPDQTRSEGEKLGRMLNSGDIVLIDGELGSGKTTFTQGIARGLGVNESTPVRSPTFTIMHQYAGRLPVRHVDLYRIESIDDLDTIGLFDVSFDGVTIVEWANKLGIESDCVKVVLKEISDTKREITISDLR